MDPSCFCLSGSGYWWWCNGVGDIFLAHFGPLSTNWASFKHHNLPEYCCWPRPSLYDYSEPIFWCTSSRIMHHVTKLKSSQTGFLNMTMSSRYSNGLHSPPQSPDLNPIEQLWDVVEREIRIMDVQPTNLQQLCDAIMSIWTKISEECFQHLVESIPRRIKAVLKAKAVQPGTSKVYLIKWQMSVHIY